MKSLTKLAIPIMASSFLGTLYNITDMAWIGLLGAKAVAGVGVGGMFTWLSQGLASMARMGGQVQVAQYIGRGEPKRAHQYAQTAVQLSVFSGLLFAAIVLIFIKPLVGFFQLTDPEALEAAFSYTKIACGLIVFSFVTFTLTGIYTAQGDSRTPFVANLIGLATNMILDPLLILGAGPIPSLGVTGAAIATVTAQCVSCILVLRCLYRSESSYQLRFSKLMIKKVYLGQIFQVGIPAGIQSTVINFSNVLLQSSVNSFGSVAMAGYTAANNIFGFLYASINAVTQACMSFTSQNYGVGKWKRMDRVLVDCLILSTTIALILGGGAYLFGPELLKIYTDDPQVISCGMEILLYTTVTYFLCGWMDLFPGSLRGMGKSIVPMLLSVIGTVGTRIVWIFGIFPRFRSLKILFISYPVSWIITIILQVICFIFVRRIVYAPLKKREAAI